MDSEIERSKAKGGLTPKPANDGVVFWRIETDRTGLRVKGYFAEARRSVDFVKINTNK
jgi:hypothetical protein